MSLVSMQFTARVDSSYNISHLIMQFFNTVIIATLGLSGAITALPVEERAALPSISAIQGDVTKLAGIVKVDLKAISISPSSLALLI